MLFQFPPQYVKAVYFIPIAGFTIFAFAFNILLYENNIVVFVQSLFAA